MSKGGSFCVVLGVILIAIKGWLDSLEMRARSLYYLGLENPGDISLYVGIAFIMIGIFLIVKGLYEKSEGEKYVKDKNYSNFSDLANENHSNLSANDPINNMPKVCEKCGTDNDARASRCKKCGKMFM